MKGRQSVTLISIADLDPGSGAFLTPGSGIRDPGWVERQHPDPGSGIRDEQTGSYFPELRNHFFVFLGVKILKFFDGNPGSGIQDPGWRQFVSGIQDPGWKKLDPGSGIRDKHPDRNTDISYSIISLRTELQKIDRGP